MVGRLKEDWQADYDRWQNRDLSARNYVYIWADGVYLQARMEDDAACMLVVIGATPEGRKELVGFQVGVRESTQSWRELLVELKAHGLGRGVVARSRGYGYQATAFSRRIFSMPNKFNKGGRHKIAKQNSK